MEEEICMCKSHPPCITGMRRVDDGLHSDEQPPPLKFVYGAYLVCSLIGGNLRLGIGKKNMENHGNAFHLNERSDMDNISGVRRVDDKL